MKEELVWFSIGFFVGAIVMHEAWRWLERKLTAIKEATHGP